LTPAEAIEALLAARRPGATICPSEAARLLAAPGREWRGEMARIHEAAARLAGSGRISLSWRGAPMDVPQGPYRIAGA